MSDLLSTDSLIDAGSLLPALRSLSEQVVEGIYQGMRDAVSAAEQHAKTTRLFQDRHPGNGLRQSISGAADREQGRLFAFAKHARFIEDGTPAHFIPHGAPQGTRGGRVLSWVKDGQRRFARWVYHPGTSPRPFMRQAAEHGEVVLEEALDTYSLYAIQRTSFE